MSDFGEDGEELDNAEGEPIQHPNAVVQEQANAEHHGAAIGALEEEQREAHRKFR